MRQALFLKKYFFGINKRRKKNIIVHLNCHTHPIASILSDVFPSSDYNIIKVINFMKEPIDESLLKKCDIYIYQYIEGDHWGEYISDSFLDKLPKHCIAIRYPILRFNPFWPFSTKKIYRNKNNEVKKSELFPNRDLYLESGIKSFKSSEVIADEYLKSDLSKIFDLDFEFSKILEWYGSERNSLNINVKEFVLENYKKEWLFHTVDHVSDFFLNYITDEIFSILGIKRNKNYHCKFMSENSVPIHPSIINHFGLLFVNKNYLYPINGKFFTSREYYINHVQDWNKLMS